MSTLASRTRTRRNKWSAEKENILKACENHETRRRFLLHQIWNWQNYRCLQMQCIQNLYYEKSVIRTIVKMIADGMNNAQNEWVCNITERFRERTMFCNFFFLLLFFHLHRVILLSGALHVCNCGFLRKSRYVQSQSSHTYV